MALDRQKLVYAARRIVDSRADAEDLVQDTLVRAFDTFADWRAPDPAWLFTVLRNIAVDRRRRVKTESRHADHALTVASFSDPQWEVDSEVEAAIRHLLSRVSVSEGAVILLRDVFELDYQEIAELLGKSESATRQALRRARVRAREAEAQIEANGSHVQFLCRAIEAREPERLAEMFREVAAQMRSSPALCHRGRSSRSTSLLVQVNGRYAIALVLDGIVLCIVPVGDRAMQSSEAVQLAYESA